MTDVISIEQRRVTSTLEIVESLAQGSLICKENGIPALWRRGESGTLIDKDAFSRAIQEGFIRFRGRQGTLSQSFYELTYQGCICAHECHVLRQEMLADFRL